MSRRIRDAHRHHNPETHNSAPISGIYFLPLAPLLVRPLDPCLRRDVHKPDVVASRSGGGCSRLSALKARWESAGFLPAGGAAEQPAEQRRCGHQEKDLTPDAPLSARRAKRVEPWRGEVSHGSLWTAVLPAKLLWRRMISGWSSASFRARRRRGPRSALMVELRICSGSASLGLEETRRLIR